MKTVLCVLVFGAYVSILLRTVKGFERRRLAVVGEAGDGGEDRVFLFIILFAFVGTLLSLSG